MNVLIVKTSAMGDIVQSFGVLEYLKAKFPDSQIDWVVSPPAFDLVSSHPLIRRTIPIDLKGSLRKTIKELRRDFYDILFDLQGNTKSGVISAFCLAKHKVGFGSKSVSEWPNLLFTSFQYNVRRDLNIREQYVQLLKKYFKDNKRFESKGNLLNIDQLQEKQIKLIFEDIYRARQKNWFLEYAKNAGFTDCNKVNINLSSLRSLNPKNFSVTLKTKFSSAFDKDALIILVSPGSKWRNKRLDIEILKAFLQKIAKKGNVFFLFLWGTEGEKIEVEKLHLFFKNNSYVLDSLYPSALQHLIKNVDLVIAMDSFPLHLSAGVDTFSFGIFGPTLASHYNPIKTGSYFYQGSCPFDQKFEKRCPLLRTCSNPRCMQDIKADQLYQAISSNFPFTD
jgi:heptosyltransferase I